MANFPIPTEPPFNVDNVPMIKESDFVVADFVNNYYLIFLYNMKYLQNLANKKVTQEQLQELADKIGDIDGSVKEQIDSINEALEDKADLNSPNFTGNPRVPTATAGTKTTQAASTAFVGAAIETQAQSDYLRDLLTKYGVASNNVTITESGGNYTITDTSDEAVNTTSIVNSSGTITITSVLVPTEGDKKYTTTTVISETAQGRTVNTSYVEEDKT